MEVILFLKSYYFLYGVFVSICLALMLLFGLIICLPNIHRD